MVSPPDDDAVRTFPMMSAIDTCSVWNILCSQKLAQAAKSGKRHFILAEYVLYECLTKPRKGNSTFEKDLQQRLRKELEDSSHFSSHNLTVEDLQTVSRHIGALRRFDRGELAALAVAHKLRNGFITDDRTARMVGESTIGKPSVRTTPHLVGWLVYSGQLSDSDIPTIIADNENFRNRYGSLGKYIQACYEHAMGLRLRERL